MSATVQHAPRLTSLAAERAAVSLYGIVGEARSLPSERDQNFLIAVPDGADYVLKIANAGEPRSILELQNAAMIHAGRKLQEAGSQAGIPQPCPTLDGDLIAELQADEGADHLVRLLSYLDGRPLATVRPHSAALLEGLGAFFGNLDQALAGFDHPAAARDFHWDLARAGDVVDRYLGLIQDRNNREVVDQLYGRYRSAVLPHLPGLRSAVIHSDGNDYNVLAARDGQWGHRIAGVIDFGDMVYSNVVNELAIVIAYAMMGKAHPLAAAAHVIKGYHARHPLTEMEIGLLFDLSLMRLCMSVTIGAHQQKLSPDNEYLGISQTPAWNLLKQLADEDRDFATYRFRHACGLEPNPTTFVVVDWLAANPHQHCSPIANGPDSADELVLDLSVGSPLLDEPRAWSDRAMLSQRVADAKKEAGATLGIGRYGEARLLYTAPQFDAASEELPERRTVHLGLDLFAAPGTPVRAALKGRVRVLADNGGAQEYGPTVVLEHATDRGVPFYTLYGHLGSASLIDLQPGQVVAKGDQIGVIGDAPQNGDWPPHLHFQIITDLLGQAQNFPGVAAPQSWPIWASVCPDPNVIVGIPAQRFPALQRDNDDIVAVRRASLGKSLSLSYSRPLKIVRGAAQYLYDDWGRAYLDVVNNVCHVGHSHPHVVRAGSRQMAVLNTNTRYLHDNIVDYAERLLATLPDPLSVCFFVCSGSEANELALRMARTYTRRQDIITVDGAYHGNTQALIDISPYKFAGPGGQGAPPWVHVATMPDGYRGPYKGQGAEVGVQYAAHVAEVVTGLQQKGRPPAAFICESVLGCGGQIVLPDGYLAAAFEHVRRAGGVTIADEVQVGFGRVGSAFWGFQTQGAVPDIVTMGKPIGNGHPLAAVVTTPAIADAFANGMEYFNTFGGNPVSCAIGAAVLDVIEQEGLQENALRVGDRLLCGLRDLASRHPLVGDVRGLGLFAGVELVLDRETLTPAGEHASQIANRMKEHGILISTDGPLHNVLKMKPPIVFNEENAARLVSTLDKILAEDALQV